MNNDEEFADALRSAFPRKLELVRMLQTKLGINLEEVAAEGDNLIDSIFKLIVKAKAQNRSKELLEAAHEFNPGNIKLAEFYKMVSQVEEIEKDFIIAASPRFELQTPPQLYVEREGLILRIQECVKTSRLVTLIGIGGTGKSTLVRTVVEKLSWPYKYYRFAPGEEVRTFLENLVHLTLTQHNLQDSAKILGVIDMIGKVFDKSEVAKDLKIRQAVIIVNEHLSDHINSETLFILDDYHLIADANNINVKDDYEKAISDLMMICSSSIKFIITCRTLIDKITSTTVYVDRFSVTETKSF